MGGGKCVHRRRERRSGSPFTASRWEIVKQSLGSVDCPGSRQQLRGNRVNRIRLVVGVLCASYSALPRWL